MPIVPRSETKSSITSGMNSETEVKVRKSFYKNSIEHKNKPITYVEIGLWMGVNAEWMCKHILTHPESRGYGIDPFFDRPIMKQFVIDRLKPYHNFVVYADYSWYILTRVLHRIKIDLLYIDGDHTPIGCLQDWVSAWPLLNIGATIILDDAALPDVKKAIEAIKLCYGNKISLFGSQEIQTTFKKVQE